jgi:hypothetical protein
MPNFKKIHHSQDLFIQFILLLAFALFSALNFVLSMLTGYKEVKDLLDYFAQHPLYILLFSAFISAFVALYIFLHIRKRLRDEEEKEKREERIKAMIKEELASRQPIDKLDPEHLFSQVMLFAIAYRYCAFFNIVAQTSLVRCYNRKDNEFDPNEYKYWRSQIDISYEFFTRLEVLAYTLRDDLNQDPKAKALYESAVSHFKPQVRNSTVAYKFLIKGTWI